MQAQNKQSHFEEAMLPHLNAAYNLARWLTGNNQDAEDMVQEAYLRALKSFDGFHGDNSRAWLLTIVRNTCYTWLQRNKTSAANTPFDEEVSTLSSDDSEEQLLQQVDHHMLRQALDELPVEFREAIVLREMDGLSYKEIAQIARVPLGTVMSRLARARKQLQQSLATRINGE